MPKKPATPGNAIAVTQGQWQLSQSAYQVFRAERVSAGLVIVVHFEGPDEGDALGAMAHVQLPNGPDSQNASGVLTVESALETMEKELLAKAEEKEIPVASISEMQVFLAGGAQLFAFGGGNNALNIGSRNVDAAKRWLKTHHALVTAESVGENRARNVEYHVSMGYVWVTPLGGEDALLTGPDKA
jgi:chemotaxis protein CheD